MQHTTRDDGKSADILCQLQMLYNKKAHLDTLMFFNIFSK